MLQKNTYGWKIIITPLYIMSNAWKMYRLKYESITILSMNYKQIITFYIAEWFSRHENHSALQSHDPSQRSNRFLTLAGWCQDQINILPRGRDLNFYVGKICDMFFSLIENIRFYFSFPPIPQFRCFYPFIVIKKFSVGFHVDYVILL